MLVVISPAKKMDWSERDVATTTPDFLEDAARLVDAARGLSVSDLKSLMSLSENLATRLTATGFRAIKRRLSLR